MPEEPHIFTFTFAGRSELLQERMTQPNEPNIPSPRVPKPRPATPAAAVQPQPSGRASAVQPQSTPPVADVQNQSTPPEADFQPQPRSPSMSNERLNSSLEDKTIELVALLNYHSDQISQDIQRELQKSLPPFTFVQAEVSFREGSVLMTGTIVMLDWVGGLAFKAAKEEFEKQFASVIKIGVQRVFSRVVTRLQLTDSMQAMNIAVTPVASTTPNATASAQVPAGPPVSPPGGASAGVFLVLQRLLTFLLILNLLMFLTQAAILVERYVTVQSPASKSAPPTQK